MNSGLSVDMFNFIPYDYRLRQLIYKFKCFIWHRYTTVRPRYLGHTWCDVVELLPHAMFELLSRYVEEEADQIEWYGDYPHMIDGKNVRVEMQELYDWWNNRESIEDIIFKELELHEPINDNILKPKYRTPDDKLIYKSLLRSLNKLENLLESEREINMIRLVKIRRYLWS